MRKFKSIKLRQHSRNKDTANANLHVAVKGEKNNLRIRKVSGFLLRWLLIGVTGAVLLFGIPWGFVDVYARSRVFSIADAPHARVAIVFGAGLNRNGTPSAVLRDRVETAAQLYLAGKVDKLLMSGDNRFINYNEPGSMRQYALDLGVPDSAIVLDFAGRRTYDTCYRARHIFDVQEAVLVTQTFHMPRALFTCNNLGIQATGVPSDIRQYLRRSYAYWTVREITATTVAIWEVWVSRPLPVLGKPEPIFSENRLPAALVLRFP